MTYELAKKLKDGGFPQEGMGINSEDCYLPTLSELIEACGEKFGRLERTKMPSGIINWNAIESYPNTLLTSMSYSTPEIAVANLWLELNKESDEYIPDGSEADDILAQDGRI